MLQQVMTKPGEISFREIDIPKAEKGEVLVRMLRIGVCGSDIHVYHGKHPYTKYPVTQGHEAAGEIAKIGPGVTGFKIGDLVTIQPQIVCGSCYPCTHGRYNICDNLKVMGFQATGMASEYFKCEASKVLKLAAGMDADQGAMVEPAAVANHAVGMAGDVKDKKVLVLGAGPVGNLVAQTSKALGAASTMIADLSHYRLEIAQKVGINFIVDPSSENLSQETIKAFGPDKADIILECVGAQATIDLAIETARKGTRIVIVGVFGEKPRVDLGLVQDRELQLVGTAMYQTCDYEQAMSLIAKGKVQLKPLMSDHFPFTKYLDAYKFIDEHKDKVMKVFIDIDKKE
ncbi:MAG TPA: alcohol dehydrogenase catalytic domain-containing protein [Methanocellales archaeon]|nr:alcohol dehydrogenase catalytic domain-containing protein [Methanocellales archaeon]